MGVKTTSQKPSRNLKRKNILSIKQLNQTALTEIFLLAEKMRVIATHAQPSKILAGKIVTLLFYEPSSRTLSSFDAAIKQLGGQTIVINNPTELSSIAKGESFEDTVRTLEAYCDAIVIRHPQAGFAEKAADSTTSIPIINAGDGIGEHPTQALLDLFTIKTHKKSLDNLKGLIVGDLMNGRTVHSLLRGLSLYKNNEIYLLAPRNLGLQKELLKELTKTGLSLFEISSLNQIPSACDFWYWTRVQKERFKTLAEYKKVNNKFIVTKELLDKFGTKDTILLHPLPRTGEIKKNLDDDPRSVYLKTQIRNGMYIRMALLALILT